MHHTIYDLIQMNYNNDDDERIESMHIMYLKYLDKNGIIVTARAVLIQ